MIVSLFYLQEDNLWIEIVIRNYISYFISYKLLGIYKQLLKEFNHQIFHYFYIMDPLSKQ